MQSARLNPSLDVTAFSFRKLAYVFFGNIRVIMMYLKRYRTVFNNVEDKSTAKVNEIIMRKPQNDYLHDMKKTFKEISVP